MPLALLRHKRIGYLLTFSILMVFIGTVLFSLLEGWTFIDSFYFTITTMTTVGFGDLTVTSDVSKLVASLYMILSVPILLIAIEYTVEVMYGDVHGHRRVK